MQITKSEINKMKKLLIITIAILLTLTLTACSNSAMPNTPSDNNTPVLTPEQNDPTAPSDNNDITGRTIVISDTEGNDVKMTRGEGREYDVTSGTRMSDGYTAHTGSASHISLLFDNSSTVKTDELTKVEVEQIAEKKLSLILLEGAIVADIATLQKGETFDFKAGNVTLGIRGTSFIMEYRNESEVIIIMLEGSGYINGDTLLEAGYIAIISLHDISIEPLTTASPLSAFALIEIGVRIDLPESTDGVFEGERDVNGNFTGWGTWVYHNIRYEGNFVDGMPNGEGVLYRARVCSDGHETGRTHALLTIIKGTFTNGYADGRISYTWHMCHGGDPLTWNFDVAMGVSTIVGEKIIATNGVTDLTLGDGLFAVVPPFVSYHTDPDIAPPTGE